MTLNTLNLLRPFSVCPSRLSSTLLYYVILSIALSLILGCSNQLTESKSSEKFDQSNWGVLDSDPDSYKGATVEVVGKVFRSPDKTDTGWQMWADPNNSKYNTLVFLADPNFNIKDGDFVRVKGAVRGSLTGTNAFGAKVSAPLIDADTATVVDALAVASPATHTVFNKHVSETT